MSRSVPVKSDKQVQRKVADIRKIISVDLFLLLAQLLAVTLDRLDQFFGNRAQILSILPVFTLRGAEKLRRLLNPFGDGFLIILDKLGLRRRILVRQSAEASERSIVQSVSYFVPRAVPENIGKLLNFGKHISYACSVFFFHNRIFGAGFHHLLTEQTAVFDRICGKRNYRSSPRLFSERHIGTVGFNKSVKVFYRLCECH